MRACGVLILLLFVSVACGQPFSPADLVSQASLNAATPMGPMYPTNMPGLTNFGWYNADLSLFNNANGYWTDLSTNGFGMTNQGPTAFRPTKLANALGTNSAISFNNQDVTNKQISLQQPYTLCWTMISSNANTGNYFGATNNTVKVAATFGSISLQAGSTAQSFASIVTNKFATYVAVFNGANSLMFVNGQPAGGPFNVGSNPLYQLGIGADATELNNTSMLLYDCAVYQGAGTQSVASNYLYIVRNMLNFPMTYTNFVPADFTALTNAFGSVIAGDAVSVASGTIMAPAMINFPAVPFELVGAGAGMGGSNSFVFPDNVSFTLNQYNNTNITTIVSPAVAYFLNIPGQNSGRFTMHGFNIVGNIANTGGSVALGNNAPSGPSTGVWHIYDCQFTNIAVRGVTFGNGDYFGLIDHCFLAVGTNSQNFDIFSGYGNSYWSWTNMNSPLGTSNACIVENCVISNGTANIGDGFIDTYQGSQFVLRYNFFYGPSSVADHGYDSDINGGRSGENWHNIYTNYSSGSCDPLGDVRAGQMQTFSNWVYGTSATTLASLSPNFQDYRACAGSYQATYGYAGFDLTNWFTTNIYGTMPSDGYMITNIWWSSRLYSTGYFNTMFTGGSTNVDMSHGPVPSQVAYGAQDYYTYDTNLNNSAYRHIQLGTNMAETIINTVSLINWNLADAGKRWSSLSTNFPNDLGHGRNPDFWCPYYTSNFIVLRPIMDATTNVYGYPHAYQPSTYSLVQRYTNFWQQYPCYNGSNVVYVNGVLQALPVWGLKYSNLVGSNGYPNYVTQSAVGGRDWSNALPTYTRFTYPHPMSYGNPALGPDVTTGMVAWWKFDESGGTSANDSNGGTNTLNYSGSVGPGLFISGKGHSGNCFTNAGTGAFTNLFKLGVPVFNTNTGFSVSFWAANTNTSSSGGYVYEEMAPGANASFYLFPFNSGNLLLAANNDAGSTIFSKTLNGLFPQGAMVHCVVTASPSGSITVYTNSVAYTNFPSTNWLTSMTVSEACVGAQVTSAGAISSPCIGFYIDEMRLYRITLTLAQVQALYGM